MSAIDDAWGAVPPSNLPVSQAMQEAIEMITGTCPGQVFFSLDFPQAIIIGDDSTWIARVSYDGSTEESYLSTIPIESYVSAVEDTYTIDHLSDLQGFTTGFTA